MVGADAGRDVSSRVLRMLVDGAEDQGVSAGRLLHGTGLSIEAIRGPVTWLPWQAYNRMLANAASIWSDDQLIELSRSLASGGLAWRFRVMGPLLYSPSELFRMVAKPEHGLLSQHIRLIDSSFREPGDCRIEIDIHVRSIDPPERALFLLIQGALASVPTVLGLPEAEVELTIDGSAARYEIGLPRSSWLHAAVLRMVSWPVALVSAARGLREVRNVIGQRSRELADMRRSLLEMERDYMTLQEQAADGIAIADASLKPHTVNSGLCEMLGYSRVELLEMSLLDVLAPGEFDPERQDLKRLLAGHDILVEHQLIRKNGTRIPVEIRARRLDDGRIQAILRDVSERRHLEEARQRTAARLEEEVAQQTVVLQHANDELRRLRDRQLQAERLGAAGELAASVAHVINNPLAALLGTLEMQIEASPAPEPALLRSLELAERIKGVVRRTLELFRQGAMKTGIADPVLVLTDVRDELVERIGERNIEVSLKVEQDMDMMLADRELLTAAIVSVAENAIDAQPDGGSIWLSASRYAGLGVIQFAIEDAGPGIPEQARLKVMEPFFSTKGGGTGLGLAIACNVVQGHSGRLQIADRAGGGTRVTIEIPTRS